MSTLIYGLTGKNKTKKHVKTATVIECPRGGYIILWIQCDNIIYYYSINNFSNKNLPVLVLLLQLTLKNKK